MTFVQAAIDDSGNEPNQRIYVLAGFAAPAENWIAFSLAWDRALKAAPYPVAFVKYKEAMRLRGQFDERIGWTETKRDAFLATLTEIIAKYAPARFHASLHHADYQRYIRDIAPARVRTLLTDTPYILLAARALVSGASAIIERQMGDEAQFFYDTQPGQDVVLTALWPSLARSVSETPIDLPAGFKRPRILSPVRFDNEIDWLPLQASDLLAGAVRSGLMENRFPEPLSGIEQVPGVGFNLDEETLREMGERLEQMMQDFARENPGIPLFHYDEQTARRDRKRVRRGLMPNRRDD